MILNNLLIKQYNPSPLQISTDLAELYVIGTSNTNQPIYWQINPDWSIVNARYQSRALYQSPQGIFGLHLLNLAGDNTAIYFMRSEQECFNLAHLIPNNRGYQCLYMFIPEQAAVNQLIPHLNTLKRCKMINFSDIKFNIPLKVIESVNKNIKLDGPFDDDPEPRTPDFTMLNYPVKCRMFDEFRTLLSETKAKYSGIMSQLDCDEIDVRTMN